MKEREREQQRKRKEEDRAFRVSVSVITGPGALEASWLGRNAANRGQLEQPDEGPPAGDVAESGPGRDRARSGGWRIGAGADPRERRQWPRLSLPAPAAGSSSSSGPGSGPSGAGSSSCPPASRRSSRSRCRSLWATARRPRPRSARHPTRHRTVASSAVVLAAPSSSSSPSSRALRRLDARRSLAASRVRLSWCCSFGVRLLPLRGSLPAR